MSTHPLWHFSRGRQTQAVKISGRLQSDDIQSLIHAALAGGGVLLAADWLVANELADNRLVRLLEPWRALGEDGVFLVRASTRHEPATTRAFSDWLAAYFADVPWL